MEPAITHTQKIALITGGSRGLGRNTAIAAASRGIDVIFAYRTNQAEAEKVLAPNIEVSLIVQPTDAAYLADGTMRDRWYMWKLKLLRRVAAPVFRKRMRLRAAAAL